MLEGLVLWKRGSLMRATIFGAALLAGTALLAVAPAASAQQYGGYGGSPGYGTSAGYPGYGSYSGLGGYGAGYGSYGALGAYGGASGGRRAGGGGGGHPA